MLIALAAALPLFSQPGMLNTRGGGDSPFLLQRVHQLTSALADGHFPVRWMPDANYGYGYPFFNYYAPLSIYIAAAFRLLGFGYILSIKLAQVSGFLVAAWAMYCLGRRWLGNVWAGLLAAGAYTLAPFHLVNIYVRGDSLAEFWAMAFYPLAVLTLDQLIITSGMDPDYRKRFQGDAHRDFQDKKYGFILFSLAFAGLILSHNISALIFTPLLLLYLAIGIWAAPSGERLGNAGPKINFSLGQRLAKANLAWYLLGFLLALALSAWFWLPALGESSMAQLEPVTSGFFHYSNHFRGKDLIQSSLLFDYDVADSQSFRMGLVQAIVILAGIIGLLAFRKGSSPNEKYEEQTERQLNLSKIMIVRTAFIISGLLVSTIMITALSRPLWDNLPLLAFTQFPWRFLSIQAFFGALATAGLALLPGRRIIVPVTIFLLLITSLGNLKLDFLHLTDTDITPERLAQYEWFSGNIGSTVSAEYLPPTVRPRPYTSRWLNDGERNQAQQLDNGLSSIQLLDRQATRQRWELDTPAPKATITIPTLSWPIWRASMDGQATEVSAVPSSGLIVLTIPSGDHLATFRLTRSPLRLASEAISLLALIATFWSLRPKRSWKPRRAHLIALGLLILLSLFLHALPERALPDDDLTWDFDQMAYLHHEPKGVPFEGGAILNSYVYSAEELAAGEQLTINLAWDKEPGAATTLALATPAIHRLQAAPLLVSQTQRAVDSQTVFRFTIPENAPAGLYVPRLTVENLKPLSPSGQTRGDLFLRPIRILDRPQPIGRNGLPLDARALAVKQRNPTLLDIQLQWATPEALTPNYNFSLRLVDSHGIELAQFDGQPGYGFQPSSLWPPGLWVDDWLALPLPEDLPKSPEALPFALIVRLYDLDSGEVVLTRRLGELDWLDGELVFQATEPVYDLPDTMTPTSAGFGESSSGPFIRLRGYETSQRVNFIDITLYWEMLNTTGEDFYHFVHLVDPVSGEIVAQHDSMPRNSSYPTNQWTTGEIVADPLALDISDVPAGAYDLYIGLYRDLKDAFSRLPALNEQGEKLPKDRVLIPEKIIVPGS